MAQGFVKNLNLVESGSASSDRSILDNLGGTNIHQDILLFDGNGNFKSELANDPNALAATNTAFGSFVSTKSYKIFDLGTSRNWTGIGADASPAVGEVFQATGPGDISTGTDGVATEIQPQVDFQNIDDPVDGHTIVVIGQNKVGYANGTAISIDEGTTYPYIVSNSNALDRFQLLDSSNNVVNLASVATISNVSLTRDDVVSIDNLKNLNPVLLLTDDSGGGGLVSPESVDGTDDVVDYGYDTFEQTAYISNIISKIAFKKTRVPLTYLDSAFTEPVRIKGQVSITNSNNLEVGYPRTITTALDTNEQYKIIDKGDTIDADWTHIGADASPAVGEIFTANGATTQADTTAISGIGSGTVKAVNPPGLFILNGATGQEVRAFSGSDNPWEEVAAGDSITGSAALRTTSNNAQISKLTISSTGATPVLIKTDGAATLDIVDLVVSESNPTYTHKLPILVNGEQFYLLVKD